MRSTSPKPGISKRFRKLAQRFGRDNHRWQVYKPSWYHIIYHTAFRAAAGAGAKERSTDHLYWNEQGLLDKVYPHKAGIVKALFAKMMTAAMKALMPY
jgi:hypothetical protein